MIAILRANGYNTLSDAYWDLEGVERIVMGKDNHNFVLKLKKFYFFPEVIKRCQMLGITYDNIPEEIREEYSTCFQRFELVEEAKKGIVPEVSNSTEELSSEDDKDDEEQNKTADKG